MFDVYMKQRKEYRLLNINLIDIMELIPKSARVK